MELFVKQQLESFLQQYAPTACLSNIDSIVLGYVVEVLSSLGEEDGSFDVEELTEMIAAYVPEFAQIDSTKVCEWIFQLAELQRERAATISNKKHGDRNVEEKPESLQGSDYPDAVSGDTSSHLPSGDCLGRQPVEGVAASSSTATASLGGSSGGSRQAASHCVKESSSRDAKELGKCLDPEKLTMLMEMFPEVSRDEVAESLERCQGDMDAAVLTLLEFTDTNPKEEEIHSTDDIGKNSTAQHHKEHPSSCQSHGAVDEKTVTTTAPDQQLKDYVLSRYAFVDTHQDKLTHKPFLAKSQEKKLVRYRDNQVVSTKGERYTMVTKKDHEGEEMKKTYVNIKPLRKYRFH